MKKAIVICLAVLMLFALIGCNNKITPTPTVIPTDTGMQTVEPSVIPSPNASLPLVPDETGAPTSPGAENPSISPSTID